jgi:RNA polymerase sigma factor for flagellar operon FliA
MKDLWKAYKKSGDELVRNALIEHYLPLVKYTAERLASRFPASVEVDDMMSSGIFGLMDAIDRFDLERGVKFETYCTNRIRGAILDGLRELDWVPRLVRSRSNRLDKAWHGLEEKLGRPPTDVELAKDMDISIEEYDALLREANVTGFISLSDEMPEDDNKTMRKIDIVVSEKEKSPVEQIQKREIKELVVKGLSKKERLVLILYYFEELTMKEIGAILDLSESRVCQLHSRIMIRLRGRLEKVRMDLMG